MRRRKWRERWSYTKETSLARTWGEADGRDGDVQAQGWAGRRQEEKPDGQQGRQRQRDGQTEEEKPRESQRRRRPGRAETGSEQRDGGEVAKRRGEAEETEGQRWCGGREKGQGQRERRRGAARGAGHTGGRRAKGRRKAGDRWEGIRCEGKTDRWREGRETAGGRQEMEKERARGRDTEG